MSGRAAVEQWELEVTAHLPGLKLHQARAPACSSDGMVLAHSCALTVVSGLLAAVLGTRENTLHQHLRETVYEASAKQGHGRDALEVRQCFAPLLG